MNNALAVLLAEWVHHWDHTTDPDEKKLDIVEAKQHLQGLVRLIMDEDFAIAIAKRMYAHEKAIFDLAWEELPVVATEPPGIDQRMWITKAQKFVDALKDEIMEDRELTTDEQADLDRLLDKGEDIGRIHCAWCGIEIKPEASNYVKGNLAWISVEHELGICTLAPNAQHEPQPGG